MKQTFFSLNLSTLTRWITLLIIVCSLVDASPIGFVARDTGDSVTPLNGPFNVSIHGYIVGIVAILTGIYFCFFGYRFFKITMFLAGFWLFSNLTYIGMARLGASDTLTLIIAIIVGLLGGGLFACCWYFGLYILAALAGYVLALWILALKIGGLIEGNVGRAVFIAVLVVAAVILMWVFERLAVVLATSLVGAFLIMFGIDVFAHTGFAVAVQSFLDGGKFPDNVDTKIYIMLVSTLVLAIIGILIQYRLHWKKKSDVREGSMAPWGYKKL